MKFKFLDNCYNILVTSHVRPDGDAIGSIIATGLALEALGKNVTLYTKSSISAGYQFLPSSERIIHVLDDVDQYDTVFVLDCGDISRVGDEADKIATIPIIINIDHHITNTLFGTHQIVDTSACATAEILYNWLQSTDIEISKDIACALYTGILTDTGSFRFPNTNQAAFEICSKMVELGVEPYHIAKNVYGTYSLGRIKLLNKALDSIELSLNGKLSIMSLTQDMLKETGTQPDDINSFVYYARHIEDVKVAALIQERSNSCNNKNGKNKFHVSLRSDGSVDVSTIAVNFGGGGHPSAAGFNIETTFIELKNHMLSLAEKF